MMTVRLDADRFHRTLQEPLRRHIPFALSHAINKTMGAVRKDQQNQMDTYFDNTPNKYTKSAPQISYSDKRDLTSFLWYGDRAEYVKVLIRGGTVRARRRKLVEPVNARQTKAGRLSPGYVAKNKDKDRFFIGIPRGRPNDQRYYGLWRRYGRSGRSRSGSPRGYLRLMISMKQGQRPQEPIFPSGELAARQFERRIFRQIPISFRFAFRSADRRARNLKFR